MEMKNVNADSLRGGLKRLIGITKQLEVKLVMELCFEMMNSI